MANNGWEILAELVAFIIYTIRPWEIPKRPGGHR